MASHIRQRLSSVSISTGLLYSFLFFNNINYQFCDSVFSKKNLDDILDGWLGGRAPDDPMTLSF
jgi:hypothetical protein